MKRRRYQISIRQIMLLILLGTVWVQLHMSWHRYKRHEQKMHAFGLAIQRKPAFNLPPLQTISQNQISD